MIQKIKHFIGRIKNGQIREKLADLAWVGQYNKKHFWLVVIYTGLGLSGTVTGLLSSVVSKNLVDIITGHQTGELIKTFCLMIMTAVLSMVIAQITNYVSVMISTKISNQIRAEVFEVIMNSEWESLSGYHSGELMSRWNMDATYISSGVLNLAPNIVIYSFRLASTLWLVMKNDASFAVIALCCIPLSLFATKSSMKRMSKGNMSTLAANTKMNSFNQETFSNIQTVKAFDLVPLYTRKLRELQGDYMKVQMRFQRFSIVNSMTMMSITMLASYISYGWGVYRVWSGAISYGTMTMFLTLSTSLSGSVNNLMGLVPNVIMLTNSVKRIRTLFDLPKEVIDQKEEIQEFYQQNAKQGVGICMREVSYAYRGTQDNVFSGVNVEAHPNEIIAFVGPSGEGKTTMLRCVLSLLQPQEGQIYLCAGNSTPEDGNYKKMTASVRHLMAYVPQGNTMFSGTIAENMRNVKEDATDEEIIDALKMACAWSFVEKLPEGINSPIGEHGNGFSEGQSQRLSIARALLRRSPILLLDEATSALDITTERAVLRNIIQDDYPRTCIVTTHRPTVLNICNRVYAIHGGYCESLEEEEVNSLISDF